MKAFTFLFCKLVSDPLILPPSCYGYLFWSLQYFLNIFQKGIFRLFYITFVIVDFSCDGLNSKFFKSLRCWLVEGIHDLELLLHFDSSDHLFLWITPNLPIKDVRIVRKLAYCEYWHCSKHSPLARIFFLW